MKGRNTDVRKIFILSHTVCDRVYDYLYQICTLNLVNADSLENVTFCIDNLLASFKDWRHVEKELSEMNEHFDVMPLVKRQHNLLDNINDLIVAAELLNIKEEGEELLELMIEANNSNTGIPHLIEITDAIEISTYSFPYRIIGMITNVKMDINYTKRP